MSDLLTRDEVADFLFTEALYLDRQDWDAWLSLYTDDCMYWMPAWRDETTQTADPDRELSLIYYRGRRNLEDRVWRIRSGMSIASTPLPRTAHIISNALIERQDADAVLVASNFSVHRYDVRSEKQHLFFGSYQHQLVRDGDGWKIASKTIKLMNDVIPTVLDIYSV